MGVPRATGKRPLPSPTVTGPATSGPATSGVPGLPATGAGAAMPLVALVEDFFVARKPLKGSPHTEAAYRRDLAGVSAYLAAELGARPGELVLGQLDAKVLRWAFASFSEGHAASSIARAWTAWDQFFAFLVAEDVVVGNPMAAVAKPKVPRRAPKALQGEGTPERCSKPHGLLRTRRRPAAAPWRRAGRGRARQGRPRARLPSGPTPRPGHGGRRPRYEVSPSGACGRRRSLRPGPRAVWLRPSSWSRGRVLQPAWWQWGRGGGAYG